MRYLKNLIIVLGAVTLTLPNMIYAKTYKGELEVLVFDDFKNKTEKTLSRLHEGKNVYHLDVPKEIQHKEEWLTGAQIVIDGDEDSQTPAPGAKEKAKVIKVKSVKVDSKKSFALEAAPVVDNRKLLVLMVNFRNLRATDTVSASQLDNILFTSSRSMQKSFMLSSFNQINFVRDTNNDGQPDIYSVSLNYDASGCNYDQWRTDARNAAIARGIDVSLYRHIMLVLPRDVNCGWGGLAQVGCGTTCYSWVRAYNPADVYSQLIYTHELGHNVGMSHSSTDPNNDGVIDSEYGDAACTMGTGDFQYFKETNAPQRDKRGWFEAYSYKIKTLTASGTHSIYPLEMGLNTGGSGLLVLKIPAGDDIYYVSYRKNIGPFGSGAPNYLDRVSIHHTNTNIRQTMFIKTLGLNESFNDANKKINITVEGLGTTAQVKVTLGGGC